MVHQVLKNRRLAGPAQVAVRNKCRRGIFFFFKENTRSWRHETGHPSSPLIFSFQCCPGVFLFLSGRVSLSVWRNVNIWPRLFTHPWDEEVGFVDLPSICTQRINWASSAIYYAALLVGRRKRVPAVTALDTHRGQVVCVCRCAFLILFSRNHSWPSRLFLSVYIYIHPAIKCRRKCARWVFFFFFSRERAHLWASCWRNAHLCVSLCATTIIARRNKLFFLFLFPGASQINRIVVATAAGQHLIFFPSRRRNGWPHNFFFFFKLFFFSYFISQNPASQRFSSGVYTGWPRRSAHLGY